jgi:hypothetical protein
MVQKQAAYNRDPAGNAFADDDPLAELARLVGYDAPVARRVEPQVSSPPAAPAGGGYATPHQPVDLQNELLQDLDGYIDDRHRAQMPAASAPQEPVLGGDADLADELEWSMGEVAQEPQHSRSGGVDPSEGYGRYRLPLANFNSVRATPQHQDDPPIQRVEPTPQTYAPAPSAYVPVAFDAAVAARPVERLREPDLDFGFAVHPAQDVALAIEPERRAAPSAFQEPVFDAPSVPRRAAPSFFEDMSYQDEKPVSAPAPRVEPPRAHESVVQEPAVDDSAEDDFFAGDLELDLAEIELEMSEFEPEPVVTREAPRPAPAELPQAAPIVREATVPPVYQAAKLEVPLAKPVEQVSVAPSAPPLPFDAAEISDQDEQLEALAYLDVPDLPPVDEDKPTSYTPDYDFDIDAELANLLDKAGEPRPAQQPAPVRAAAPLAAAAVPPMAAQVKNMPSDDFDVFEKALEEDFRRSLDTQYSFGSKQPGPVAEDLDADDYEQEERSSPRRWIAVAAATAVVLVAGGGAYAWMKTGHGTSLGGDEPKIVMADKDPVKVVPANPGGKSVPNQNKAVYDRVSGAASDQPSQKNLISSGEEPMDVAQRTLGPDNLPLDDEGGADMANVNANAGNTTTGQPADATTTGDKPTLVPRRVKTMIVRPDGSLVAQDDGAAAPADAAAKTANPAQTANATPTSAAPAAASGGQSVDDVLASGGAPSADTAAADTAGVPAPNMPVPLARPTQTAAAAPATAPTKLAPPAAQQPASTSAAASGDYLIQISSLPTEADAQKSYKRLAAKFGDVIGGRGMDIKAADVPGKGTYYRVRIPAGSKDAAVSLCERYRTAGGSCMVVR